MLSISLKFKFKATLYQKNSSLRQLHQKKEENKYAHEELYQNVHSNFNPHSAKLKRASLSINKGNDFHSFTQWCITLQGK